MFRPHPEKNKCGILPPGKWRKKTSIDMTQTTPETGTKKEIRCHGDTAREGGGRKNSTARRSPSEASLGIVERKGPIPKNRERIPTEASRPGNHDKPNT